MFAEDTTITVVDMYCREIVLVTGMCETAPDEVLGREGWGDMKAIQAGAVYNVESYAMTRLAETAIGLYEFLYGVEIDMANNPIKMSP